MIYRRGALVADSTPIDPSDPTVPSEALSTLGAVSMLSDEQVAALSDLGLVDSDVLAAVVQNLAAALQAIDTAAASEDDAQIVAAASRTTSAIRSELANRHAVNARQTDGLRHLVQAAAGDADAARRTTAGRPIARPSISRLAARAPGRARPVTASAATTGRRVLTASGEVTDDDLGAVLARGLEREVRALRMSAAPTEREHRRIASVQLAYPDDRRLGEDATANMAAVEAVCGPQALVASGGVCGPVAVSYDIAAIATNERPVRDGGMVAFEASRGGLRYQLPVTFAAAQAAGAVGIWAETVDVAPGGATKAHAVYVCQPAIEAYVDAVTSIVTFGNYQARYFPEAIGEYLATMDAVHSRLAESNLLQQVSAGSVQVSAANYELGAARDVLAQLALAASAMRFQHRLSPGTVLRWMAPSWLPDLLAADLARAVPGDSGSGSERLAVATADVERWFAARRIAPTWYEDSALGGAVLQGWTPQATGHLAPWPAVTQTFLYPEGSWIFLDGGTLDLGIVRDSVLNRTNDFQVFSESFEKAILKGHVSWEIDLRLAPTGASAGTVAPSIETIGS